MEIVTHDILVKEVSLGEVRIELSIHEKDGWSVWLTARDRENRRIWRTPFTDAKGNTKNYATVQEAMKDAESQLNNILSVSKSNSRE